MNGGARRATTGGRGWQDYGRIGRIGMIGRVWASLHSLVRAQDEEGVVLLILLYHLIPDVLDESV